MRINKFLAQATGMSRRAADAAVANGKVTVNDSPAQQGQKVSVGDVVRLDNKLLKIKSETQTIMLNKPVGYVCSRNGQGSRTIYDLLPNELHQLKPVGRLDKDSSGLLLLTNNGQLANQLTHPKYQKEKVYEITLDKQLTHDDEMKIEQGIELKDGLSHLKLAGEGDNWTVKMSEGRNRQIRRTFEALGYTVTKLHRTQFGAYKLGTLASGKYTDLML